MHRSTSGHVPHLLVAEDEPAVAAVIEEHLTFAGYRITTAADGMEALEALPNGAFDLLLTDIRMPRLDGVGLVQHVRRTRPQMPIVVLSGYMTDADRRSLSNLGIPDHAVLEKPPSFVVLEEVIRSALQEAH